ncbi:MAG: biotin--[acetyl-CoA-carboxylase] ligase [Phycisphaeraceae bacterium]|nr:biotin--[acetyl-CoA-carboxylase] ligase [Phycisphaeraceae bacterium]
MLSTSARDWSKTTQPQRPLPSVVEVRAIPLESHDSIDSTSLEARRILAAAPAGGEPRVPRLIVANTQTAGVGRLGRTWVSPRGGIWFTLIWPLPPEPSDAAAVLDGLGLRIGVAVWEVIAQAVVRRWAESAVTIKWPNDILINGRKVCGLLTEIIGSPGARAALVGVGINANFTASELPDDLPTPVTTLRDELATDANAAGVLDEVLRRLYRALTGRGLDHITLMRARRQLHGVGKPARVTLPDGSSLEGTIVGLSDSGTLILRAPTGEHILPAGSDVITSPG